MEIEVIDKIEGLLPYISEWQAILKEIDNDNIFLEPDWIMLRLKYLTGRCKLFILIVNSGKKVAGICPLMVTDRGVCNEISFIGSRESSNNDFILREKYREEALGCILNFLRGLKGIYIIKLSMLAAKSANSILMKVYLKAGKVPQAVDTIVHYIISLQGKEFNAYYESKFGKNTRHTMKKKEKRLNDLGVLTYKRISSAEIDRMFMVHDKRWLRKIGNSSFSKGDTKEFYKELALNNNTRFMVTVDAITLNSKIISFIYGFEYNGRVLLIRIAHDDDFYFLSPGELVWKKKIEESFLLNARVIDFGPGYEPYKVKWANECEEIFTVIFPSDNLQSKLIFYIKYWSCIKLISAIKKNKRIYNFRKYYLGKLKYLFSRENICDNVKKVKKSVEQYGLSGYIAKKITDYISAIYSHRTYLILSKYLRGTKISEGNLRVREATIDDLEILTEVMNKSSSDIIRRFTDKHECYITTHNNELIHYCWINCGRIKISGVDLNLPLGNLDVCIYDTFLKKNYVTENNCRYILSCILNLLYRKNYKRCYVAIDCRGNSPESEIYKEKSRPVYKVIEKVLFGRIKHNAIKLS